MYTPNLDINICGLKYVYVYISALPVIYELCLLEQVLIYVPISPYI